MTTPLDRETLRRAREDVGVFAQLLLGFPLWEHQLEVATSPARVRSMLIGRQAGKTTLLAILALFTAFTKPRSLTLMVSAGDEASGDVLAASSALAEAAPLLAGSVTDDLARELRLSNGSVIRAVPASAKRVRGPSVDLLLMDEACFLDEAIFEAAKYSMIARPGSRMVLSSTPFGRRDRSFATMYRAGQRGEQGFAAWHWPSTVSPMVDRELLEMWRTTDPDRVYRREVLAEWPDEAGAYFATDELDGNLAGYELIPPEQAGGRVCVGGVDWGFAHDSSALVLLAQATSSDLDGDWPARTFWLPWVLEGVGVPYSTFVKMVSEAVGPSLYRVTRLASETNGVGQMPTQELYRKLAVRTEVVGVTTTASSKEDGFGKVKMLLQQHRLALPRHPGLLGQLAALEFEERDSGTVRIAVPERMGHDDLCMALCLGIGAAGDVASQGAYTAVRVPSRPVRRPPIVRTSPSQRGGWRRLGAFKVPNDDRYTPPQEGLH